MKRKSKKQLITSIVLLAVLVIGIGYAYLTSNLSISGTTEIANNSWDIHFENLSVTTGSVTASTPAEIDSNETSIEYAITLSRPKDFYEFTVDVKNDGTLPGKVSISELSGLDTNSSKVIDYTIAYTNGNPVNVGDILNAGAKKTIKVKVFYKDNISSTDLPSSNLHLDLTYTLQFLQSDKDEVTIDNIIQNLLAIPHSPCLSKYSGEVTDEIATTIDATKVYYYTCSSAGNIKFAGYCWQMIRTTETSGVRMIYNGEPDQNGACGASRANHKGIVGENGTTQTLNAEYLYGTAFTYDTTNNTFTLTDTTTATWSDSTYENLIGKFTCKNTTGTCTTLYNVNGYQDSTTAYTSSYTIGDTNYAQIGTSPYNANYRSPAMGGYKFNKVYESQFGSPTSGSLMGNDVSYSNGTYTLLPAAGESELRTTLDNNHHYTCNNSNGTCNKVRYYFQNNYYIELDETENIQAAVNEMLYNNDVNTYNSSIKGVIDSWYAQNILTETRKLEDTVFCNARNMKNQSINAWNKDGGLDEMIQFKDYDVIGDISCANETDQFAVRNNKAKLTYPVGLLPHEERYHTSYSPSMSTGAYWWNISPSYFSGQIYIRFLNNSGTSRYTSGLYAYGIRPVLSLKSGTAISEGDGTTTNPWVVE